MNDPWHNVPREILLCNFGGPASADEVYPFLVRLFEDPFIIRAPLGRLRPMLARRIARKRAPASAEEYKKIGFSPINRLTQSVAQGVEARLQKTHADTKVIVVNRYTAPFASDMVEHLNPNARRLVITLYPHFCHSTVASSLRDLDLAYRSAHEGRDLPATRVYSWWHHPQYVTFTADALIKKLLQVCRERPQGQLTVMYSAHGIPVRYHQRGDPYCHETLAHTEELTKRARLAVADAFPDRQNDIHFQLCYQSRVGRVEWVKPYTDDTIQKLGPERGGALVLVPLSFTSDHIETLYEMDVTYKEMGLQAGFDHYDRVPPANDDPRFLDCLAEIIKYHGF